jgi:hypothetical protein
MVIVDRQQEAVMNNPVESAEPAKNIAVSDRLLGLLYQKCEGAKTDLEHNWIYQIASVGISLGLMFGLAEPISKHFLETVGHERILYLILPAVNLYLFMRFGFLSSVFNDCRVALEVLSEKYFRDEGLSTLPRVRASSLYGSNSYFEYYHRLRINFGIFLYTLFVPLVFALSHATSAYLLCATFQNTYLDIIVISIYLVPIFSLYTHYCIGNRDIKFEMFQFRVDVPIASSVLAVLLWIGFFAGFVMFQNPAALSQGP